MLQRSRVLNLHIQDCKKSKIIKQSKEYAVVKLYGTNFKIWRPKQGSDDQQYWDSDFSSSVISKGDSSFVAKNFLNPASYDLLLDVRDIYKIQYTLLKKTQTYVLIKIENV
jgi:hypothetical protein